MSRPPHETVTALWEVTERRLPPQDERRRAFDAALRRCMEVAAEAAFDDVGDRFAPFPIVATGIRNRRTEAPKIVDRLLGESRTT